VTDLGLPGMSGVELVGWAKKESPDTQVIVMSGQETQSRYAELPEDVYLRFLEKPFEPAALLKIVDEAMDCAERLSGKLSTLGAADVIQMLCLGHRTAALRITAGDISGCVMVDGGQLVHATWGDKVGEPAICEILAVYDGSFRMAPKPGGIEPTIARDWQLVLMDCVRIVDEVRHTESKRPKKRRESRNSRPPTISIPAGVVNSNSAHSSGIRPTAANGSREGVDMGRAVAAAKLVDQGFAALRAGDNAEARKCWESAQQLDPDNRAIDLNLRKLESMRARG
jgi:hypothetical protein